MWYGARQYGAELLIFTSLYFLMVVTPKHLAWTRERERERERVRERESERERERERKREREVKREDTCKREN